MAAVLALVAACSWGASDFLGGLAGRRAGRDISLASSLAASLVGLVGLALAAAVVGGAAMDARDVAYASGAGVGGAVGLSLLYRGLTIGRMGVVAPITGAGAVALPVLVGTVSGEMPSPRGWVGVVLALVAIVLVSRERAPDDAPGAPTVGADGRGRGRSPGGRRPQPGVLEAIGSGLGFGVLFTLLDRTAEATNLWPLVPMKVASVVVLLGALLVTRTPAATPRAVWPHLLAVGVLDNLANVTYLLATRRGLLALVAVVSSLYPVGTVGLARLVLHERLVRHQVVGLGLAGVGVVLIGLA